MYAYTENVGAYRAAIRRVFSPEYNAEWRVRRIRGVVHHPETTSEEAYYDVAFTDGSVFTTAERSAANAALSMKPAHVWANVEVAFTADMSDPHDKGVIHQLREVNTRERDRFDD
jgi:hypothetical protein